MVRTFRSGAALLCGLLVAATAHAQLPGTFNGAPTLPLKTHTTPYPLAQANEALADLRVGQLFEHPAGHHPNGWAPVLLPVPR